ncbi:HicB family protein [Candidatus Roizmanbacteria bacterium CG22_combo_CG10-13_8_21_14_all_38_20]|uniref:HicB family protein n=1 Tax=Candidatus Roizmanbacteria bacterium CG22_combo_CG10-13_8_21_14_all_38_20 TaxID=1974862 RepID=A0A2H0BU25_9BACT|nr:type II toxin-antitoxin system HicB family antitoxin [Candidatus Microgenomates bacterium]PIP61195.1 MAG: HicB family protein [Candidatus Roizmanbacteria bacterium CG22_combo_CG10-13_8_21_14_all_38_20]PJC31185.1 MAG: HicB family protein [Candidatus Roizmanbacteria bacterium CG_4_9_14_0_2_um_filter_38_17]
MVKVQNFKVVIEQDENGYFVADVPSIPGCHSQGESYKEAIDNVREAIELCLEVAEENTDYKSKIEFEEDTTPSRFLGIAHVPVRFQFSK